MICDATRRAIRDIGYEQEGFNWQTCGVEVLLRTHNPAHIAQGVDASGNKDEGAGDQGIMFGYACRETPELMPAPILYSHKILRLLADVRKSGREPKLGPDAKSQVTLRYLNGVPVEAVQIVVSTQHVDENMSSQDVREIIEPYVREALPTDWLTRDTVWHVQSHRRLCHPAGLTAIAASPGAKIIVDTYGGAAPHGGGAFSGTRIPPRWDRSAAYAARYLCEEHP